MDMYDKNLNAVSDITHGNRGLFSGYYRDSYKFHIQKLYGIVTNGLTTSERKVLPADMFLQNGIGETVT